MFKHRLFPHGFMARRKAKKTPRRRNRSINVVNAAQTYLQTAILTRAAFNTNPLEFVTGQQYFAARTEIVPTKVGNLTYNQTVTTPAGFGYNPIGNGTALTLPELMGFDSPTGQSVSFGSGGMEAIKANIALNGGIVTPIVQTVGLNLGFAVAKKLLGRQRSLLNRGAKMAGFSSMVKF